MEFEKNSQARKNKFRLFEEQLSDFFKDYFREEEIKTI